MVVDTPAGPVSIRTDQVIKNEQTGAFSIIEAKASGAAPSRTNQAQALPALQQGTKCNSGMREMMDYARNKNIIPKNPRNKIERTK
jgi:hypothetical protein